MGLFKSKEERRMERDIQVRQGMSFIQRQIKALAKSEREYIDKAKRAKQMGSEDQVSFLKAAIRRTLASRKQLERQLLTIETAFQMKNQAEGYSAFAKSMNAVSKSIAEVFGATDLERTQADFEKAMMQAQSMEERMSVFLDMSAQSMESLETSSEDLGVSDAELDRMIESEAVQAERGMDDEIAKGIKEIEQALGKEKK